MRRLLVAVLLVAALAAGAALFAVHRYDTTGPLPEQTAIVVPHGGLAEVAEALGAAHVVAVPWQFEAASLLTRGQGGLHAGEFAFPAGASLRQVLAVLRSAKPIQHRLTLAEGISALQAASLIEHAPALDGAMPTIAEGSLLPETYLYERGTDRAALIGRAARAMDKALDAAWSGRAPDLPLATAREALILASIVERETAKPEERAVVAAVYLNRLRRGMKLQSDPTVVYGASNFVGVLDHGLTRAELDADTPYNTYRSAGLPPGPICMPGAASLQAATHPAATDALFFVADGSGGHVFARTEQEHQRNVARWRAAERSRAAGRALP